MENDYFDNYQAKRQAFYEALASGETPALTWDEVEGLWPAASDSLRSLMATAVESIGRRAADNTAELRPVLTLDSLRSAERGAGEGSASKCSSRWEADHYKTRQNHTRHH